MRRKTIYWFTNDLRIDDNSALVESSRLSDEIGYIYIIDPDWFKMNSFQSTAMSDLRLNFLKQSLDDLEKKLNQYNQTLHILYGKPSAIISGLIENGITNHICRSELADYNLNQVWNHLASKYVDISFSKFTTHTIFDSAELPFDIQKLPRTYTQFRKIVELKTIKPPIERPKHLPEKLLIPSNTYIWPAKTKLNRCNAFKGGTTNALKQLHHYFSSSLPHSYFDVRNSLDGWDNSTKFSIWLANGSLSVRLILEELKHYELNTFKNKSTYWIFFELLWREFYQWYAHKFGARLFRFCGIKNQKPLTSFYPERFKKWCNGTTPYPIVNACMNELNSTGYLSNRGRQITASCFINELELDWRFGAAYFEMQLLDYDVASNWGNWQYLAGVGADPQPKRQFNLDKQTEIFDPSARYINKWTTFTGSSTLDSVDAADWPIA